MPSLRENAHTAIRVEVIRDAYEKSLEREGHVRDNAQVALVDRFEMLKRELIERESSNRGLVSKLFGRRREYDGVRGIYIWGGVGRGKTFLMDLFYDHLDIAAKKRIHFHRMMHDVHDRLTTLGDVEDPLDIVAADIATEIRVLCFDEFFVSDIGDAMILGRLLDGLFKRGVTLVTTSNSKPDDLYKNGLQRQRFLPAIALLNQYTDVVNMDGGTDYRLRLLQKAGTWLTPDDDAAKEKLDYFFDESASSDIHDRDVLTINHRKIDVHRSAKCIAWFTFDALCDGPRSQADYIEIARWFPSVVLSGVPLLDPKHEDQARRFIALVDEFYDRRVKLIVSAAAAPDGLYTGKRLKFEYQRTLSRLIEMQSTEYLALPHLA